MIEFLKVQHIGPSAITWIKYEDNDEEILVFDDITIFHMKLNPPRRESKIFIKDDWIEYDCGNPKLARDMSIQSMNVGKFTKSGVLLHAFKAMSGAGKVLYTLLNT
jgi:hypothetical protein